MAIAYLVVGTSGPLIPGMDTTDFHTAGMYLSEEAAEESMQEIDEIPEKYDHLSIVRVVVMFYVCGEPRSSERPREPFLLHGPFESADQASMAKMLVDHDSWDKVSMVAMSDDKASEMLWEESIMKVQTSQQSFTCPECGQGGKSQLFKLNGQSTYRCGDCLGNFCVNQGPDKSVVIDGAQMVGPPEADPDNDGD